MYLNKEIYFDLHCDTLTRRYDKNDPMKDTLNIDTNVIDIARIPSSRLYGQFFAVFVPDSYRGKSAEEFFNTNAQSFIRQCQKFEHLTARCRNYEEIVSAYEEGKSAAVLTIEGAAAFGGNLENVEKARELGVCACTMTWNGENELASGNNTSVGLKPFGKDCIREMERNNIIVDVSHLNDNSLYDVLKFAKRPVIATHSNARSITKHLRNLKDDQIKEIIDMKGLIGLNYCIDFLNDVPQNACLEDVYRHAEHILKLGGEDVLALGSDFDGCTVFPDLDSLQKSFDLGDFFLSKGIDKKIVEKIMGKNALSFFKEYFGNGI